MRCNVLAFREGMCRLAHMHQPHSHVNIRGSCNGSHWQCPARAWQCDPPLTAIRQLQSNPSPQTSHTHYANSPGQHYTTSPSYHPLFPTGRLLRCSATVTGNALTPSDTRRPQAQPSTLPPQSLPLVAFAHLCSAATIVACSQSPTKQLSQQP